MNNVNITAWLVTLACGAVLCALWFFLADRRKAHDGKSPLLSLLVLLLDVVLGTGCARLVWVLCRINFHPTLFELRYEELSYYGGMAGVLLAVWLSAKITGRNARDTLNTFAPMGALIAAVVRFAEYFLGEFGAGPWMESGIFFPITIEIVWDADYSEFFPAVFMLEGAFSLVAMVLSLVHRDEKHRWLRTLFYLCLPQILCESMRNTSIAWLFVRSEQLFCFLLCEGVLVWYAFRAGRKRLGSWAPALTGLGVCALVIVAEFALDGKIAFGSHLISHWLIYGVVVAGLAAMAVMEHRGYRKIQDQ